MRSPLSVADDMMSRNDTSGNSGGASDLSNTCKDIDGNERDGLPHTTLTCQSAASEELMYEQSLKEVR